MEAQELRKEEGTKVGWAPEGADHSHCNAWGLKGNAPKRLAKRVSESGSWREVRSA